ncbi:MAG: LPS export ABC transporter periplasmic protein LptC [Bacteroidales bacterium]|nr:LPS export ABC transporter periplasmic protein LptC [Bacteroidales bacterium]
MNDRLIVFGIVASLTMLSFLLSCSNGKLRNIDVKVDTFPIEIAKDIDFLYTEYGLPKVRLTATVAKRYREKEGEIIKLPAGMLLAFYDSLGVLQAKISSKYAERILHQKKTILRYNVVVETQDGKRLTSEELIWDEVGHKIFSSAFVRIVTPDKIIWGDGFESDEKFEQYKILRPRGEIQINEI